MMLLLSVHSSSVPHSTDSGFVLCIHIHAFPHSRSHTASMADGNNFSAFAFHLREPCNQEPCLAVGIVVPSCDYKSLMMVNMYQGFLSNLKEVSLLSDSWP